MSKLFVLLTMFLLSGCSFFNESPKIDLIPFEQDDKYGYFDLQGKVVINPQFSFASAFREDLALVATTGENPKWGFIDKKGKVVIKAIYKEATVFQEGLAWVVAENTAASAIDKNGKIKFTLDEAEEVRLFSNHLAAFSKVDSESTLWGFVDINGKQTINPQFFEVGYFKDGKCAVKNKEGKWGYIDKSGNIIINYQFDDANKFVDGRAIVRLDEQSGVIDEEGKYIINPQFQNVYLDGDRYLIRQDDKYGWCDMDGKYIINPQFTDANFFAGSKLASFKSGEKYGYINKDGQITINPQFDEASQFFGDVAIVKTGDKYGLIDPTGKYKVNPQFDDIGIDVFFYMNDLSRANSVKSDFLNTQAILKVINLNSPENLTFDDSFQTILRKKNLSADGFNAYDESHLMFKEKFINNEASYAFLVMGKLKALNYETYDYYITDEKPTGFIYLFNLSGKAEGKSEAVQRAFEEKLPSYTLIKKGYVDGAYTGVYTNTRNILITNSKNPNTPLFYILNKNFDISFYLTKIVENIDDKPNTDEIVDEEESSFLDSLDVDTIAEITVDSLN